MSRQNTYNRSIKCFNEPHTPEELDRMVADKTINRGKFLNKRHAGSYQEQIKTILRLGIERVLEIGPGEGYTARNLNALGLQFDTLDFEGAHKPTIQADFNTFDPKPYSGKYELCCGFQVLEHFPFEDFPRLVDKMVTMSSRYVYLSVPYSCYGFHFELGMHTGQLPFSKRLRFYMPSYKKNRKYREGFMKEFPWAVHYWEIGRKGFPLKRINKTIEACGLKILEQNHGPNPFHYYFLCEKIGE